MSKREIRFIDGTRAGARWGEAQMNALLKPPPPTVADRMERFFLLGLYALLALVLADQIRRHGGALGSWDLMFVSGLIAAIAGFHAAGRLRGRMAHMLERLVDRKALVFEDGDAPPELLTQQLLQEVERRAMHSTHRTGLVIAGMTLLANLWLVFLALEGGEALGYAVFWLGLQLVGAYLAGRHFGRAITYGRLSRLLRSTEITVRAQPGHPDGVAGLQPVGEFYFFQAMLLAIPAAHLALWWFLIPLGWERYARWQTTYLILLLVILTLEILAFILPLRYFHRQMILAKRTALKEADRLSQEIVALQKKLTEVGSGEQRQVSERLDLLQERYREIEKMPTWPVAMQTRKRFTASNLSLFLPIGIKILGLSELWAEMANALWNVVGPR
ncbi:MAG: hypothetical protein R3272_17235 [Candidatus Promineifilaceae bacterium]|nr:hypothetical protein [Candidatus Promineifilaceae bacterium]